MERVVPFDGIVINGEYECFGPQDEPEGRFSESGDVWDIRQDDRTNTLNDEDEYELHVNGQIIYASGVTQLIMQLDMSGAFYDMDDI